MRFQKRALLPLLGLLSAPVFAAPIDVAAVVTDIGGQVAPVVAIGGAILLVMVAVKAFKWVRAALS